ncbi:MAG: anthranilate synthase component I family protein [Planctomycetaceae bacterium]|nr:anthranilate synthase component I family protein [Planctomycetaceae bacterium]
MNSIPSNPSTIARLAEPMVVEPLVVELEQPPDPEEAFLRLAGRPHCLFLDSARRDRELGRFSFLAADPFEFLECAAEGALALPRLAAALAPYRAAALPGLPPFQGGAAGLLSYDLGRQLERLPRPAADEFGVPVLAVGLYDVVLAYDHQEHRAWIFSWGLPETDPERRRRRAEQRLHEMQTLLAVSRRRLALPAPPASPAPAIAAGALARQFAVPGPQGLTSNFSRDGYLRAVARAIEYIQAGDIFQVNLSQRLLFPAHDDSISLYQRLRRQNAATFAAYFDLGEFQLVSASPERFLQVRQGVVEARPIKGTRQRTKSPEADLFAGDELQESEKDRAENVMIVDLLRNDLSRVCRPESVQVSELCRLEISEYVQHLVSVVQGRLRPECAALDLIRCAFPGGSITGAPKVRAMEIIAELEPTARGPYCGALGYLGFDGTCDTSILIRTITAGRGWWQAPVGGGIVAQSHPLREYAETWHKAEGILRALAPPSASR